MQNDITDPARELGALLDRLRAFETGVPNGQNQPASWQVLSRGWNIDPASPIFLELLSIVRNRLFQLDSFIAELDDPTVGQDVVQRVQGAIANFAGALNPGHLHQNWNHVLSNWLRAEDATTIRMFSPVMIKYKPLRVLGNSEREDALNAIKDAIKDISDSKDLNEWEKKALLYGYARLELILRYFEIFGHEGLNREIALTASVTRAAAENLKPTSTSLGRAWSALVLTAKIVEIVAAPAVAYHAITDYSTLLKLGSPTHAQAFLPAPTPPDGKNQNRQEAPDSRQSSDSLEDAKMTEV